MGAIIPGGIIRKLWLTLFTRSFLTMFVLAVHLATHTTNEELRRELFTNLHSCSLNDTGY